MRVDKMVDKDGYKSLLKAQKFLQLKYDNICSNISHHPAFIKDWSKAEATAKAC